MTAVIALPEGLASTASLSVRARARGTAESTSRPRALDSSSPAVPPSVTNEGSQGTILSSGQANDACAPDPLDFVQLRVWAECFEDVQRARIACSNRAERGGVPSELFEAQLGTLRRAEHDIGLAMRRCFRRVAPATIVEWQRSTHGIGEHLLARLLGTIGHPRIATPHHWEGSGSERVLIPDPPFERSVSQLRQFCGFGDPNRKRTKGMTADDALALGNPRAKTLVRQMAECSMKARGPHRVVYDRGRALYAERDWTDGHRHAAALRLCGKEILRDLWVAADWRASGAAEEVAS